MKSAFITAETAQRSWYVLDAEGKPLGRIAAKVAYILRGKNKPTFTPSQETGDFVVVINSGKVGISGRKRSDKMYYHHTGFPGGLKEVTFDKLLARHPTQPLELAVKGMLPNGPLGRKLMKNAKFYAGPTHPHAAQQPTAIEL
jgi:large subunit ribosomal protein L13